MEHLHSFTKHDMAWSRIATAMAGFWERRAEARARRRAVAELRVLGGAALRDLAIDPSEITSVVHDTSGERRRSRGAEV